MSQEKSASSVKKLLIVEIRTEDLPPNSDPDRYFLSFAESLRDSLEKRGVLYRSVMPVRNPERFSTPRRIAFQAYVEPHIVMLQGPAKTIAYRDGNPTKALEGFLRSRDAKKDDIEPDKENIHKYVRVALPPVDLTKEIGNILEEALTRMELPRQMQWESPKKILYKFVRRISGISIYLAGKFVKTKVFGISTTPEIGKHRFFVSTVSSALTEPATWENYKTMLKDIGVMGDSKDRFAYILDAADDYRPYTAVSNEPPALTLIQMCEYPTAIKCTFSEQFLELPPAAIEEVGRKHLRVFTNLGNEKKEKHNQFLFIADRKDPNNKLREKIRAGVEAVMTARLADALFLYRQDKQLNKENLFDKLDGISYVNGLGSMLKRCKRLKVLADKIASDLNLDQKQRELAVTAAELCKIDLGAQLVNELPYLEGKIAGKILGLPKEINLLLETHLERDQTEGHKLDGRLKENEARVCLVLTHEFEHLVANVAVRNLRVTGAGDRSGIRRSVTRILSTTGSNFKSPWKRTKQDLNLCEFIDSALEIVKKDVSADFLEEDKRAKRFDDAKQYLYKIFRNGLYSFHLTLLKVVGDYQQLHRTTQQAIDLMREFGKLTCRMDRDIGKENGLFVRSSLARSYSMTQYLYENKDEPLILNTEMKPNKAPSLDRSNKFLALGGAIKRLENILANKGEISGRIDTKHFSEKAEENLYAKTQKLEEKCRVLEKKWEYSKLIEACHALVPSVNAFFDNVMVNDPDKETRDNRLALVKLARNQILSFARKPDVSN